MKNIYLTIFLFLLLANVAFCQYSPFSSSVTKRFYDVENLASKNYFFYADSASVLGNTTTFYQYYTSKAADPNLQSQACPVWGSITKVVDTTWLGENIIYEADAKKLRLQNKAGESIVFDFSLSLGDSSIFYQLDDTLYYIKNVDIQIQDVYGVQDSVKSFRILQYDDQGNSIQSPLHGFDIKIGKTLGLLSFIDVFHFPQVKVKVGLQGQLSPLIGNYQMTYEELYPWQIGDVFQYNGYYKSSITSALFSDTYITRTVINRIETQDSIIFHFQDNQFIVHNYIDVSLGVPSYPMPLSNPLRIAKNTEFLPVPHNREILQPIPYRNDKEGQENVCSWSGLYTITNGGEFISYCEEEKIFHQRDGFGSSIPIHKFTKGLGQTDFRLQFYGAPSSGEFRQASLIYAKTGSSECGSRLHVGLEEQQKLDIYVFPNPVSDVLYINTTVDQLSIYGMDGKVLRTISNTPSIEISDLAAGLYTVKLLKDGNIRITRFVKR